MQHLLLDLYQVCSYDATGVKIGPRLGGHLFEHRNKEGKLQSSSTLKLEGLELSYYVYSISVSTSTKFVHMMPPPSKLAPPRGSQVVVGWLVVLGFNATLTAKVISWRSVTHMCFLAFSHQY